MLIARLPGYSIPVKLKTKIIRSILMIGFIALVLPGLTLAEEIEPRVIPIWESGPSEKRTNIVFLSEGYTPQLTGKFTSMVLRTWEEMKLFPPFSTHMNHFNLYAIWTPSKDKGVSNRSSIIRDTYYGVTAGSCASMSIDGKKLADKHLEELVPDWTVAIMFYRDEDELGFHTCAGRITITPDRWSGSPLDDFGQEQVNVVLHEYGHILANLRDEHELGYNCKETAGNNFDHHPPPHILAKLSAQWNFQNTYANNVQNTSTRDLTSMSQVPWKDWIEPETPIPTPLTNEFRDDVGYYKSKCKQSYRPMQKCKMRSVQTTFCKVCNEGLLLSFYNFASPIDTAYPAKSWQPATLDDLNFKLELIRDPSQFKIEWKLNGSVLPGENSETLQLSPDQLPQGNHKLMANVKDTTSAIRMYPDDERLSSQWEWTIQMQQTISVNKTFLKKNTATSTGKPFNIQGRRIPIDKQTHQIYLPAGQPEPEHIHDHTHEHGHSHSH